MIRKLTTLLCILSVTSVLNAQVQTPQPSPGAKIEQTIGLTTVNVDYSRPSMRERVIFGNLVPYGKIWRTGANMRTKISFDDDVTIDGKELKAGTYAILTIPSENSWDVVFYTEYNAGGAPAELDADKVALQLSVASHTLDTTWQSFTIAFGNFTNNSGSLYIGWENTMVKMNIGVPSDEKAVKSIETVLAGPSANDYFQSAAYYFGEGKDLNQAKKWIDQAIELNKETPRFWQLRMQALIYAGSGNKKEAISIAKQSLELAEEAGNADYAKMNKESIAEWSK